MCRIVNQEPKCARSKRLRAKLVFLVLLYFVLSLLFSFW